MKLNELVQKVQQTVDDNKEKWGFLLPKNMPQIYFTHELRRELYAPFAGDLDIKEIQNITKTYWTSGIPMRLMHEMENAIALGLVMQCHTNGEYDKALDMLEDMLNGFAENNRRLNKIKIGKAKDRDYRLGTYDKVEFIQRFGSMYDDEEEANKDANDKSGICPLLMSVFNTGWHDIMAVENDGKVVVSNHGKDAVGNGKHDAGMFLIGIKVAMERIGFNNRFKSRKEAIRASSIAMDLMMAASPQIWQQYKADVHCSVGAFVDAVDGLLSQSDIYSQDIFDFATVNTQFMKVMRNAQEIIENLDETQMNLARDLYCNTLSNLDEMANIECRIIKEQTMRDPSTGKFLKPHIDPKYMVYTVALNTMLWFLGMRFDAAMRLQGTGRTSFDGNWAYCLCSIGMQNAAIFCVKRKFYVTQKPPLNDMFYDSYARAYSKFMPLIREGKWFETIYAQKNTVEENIIRRKVANIMPLFA